MIPTDIMLNKGRCDKTVWFYLYSIQEQAKWIDVDTWSQKGDYRWGGWVKWRERTFWGDRNILYLDLDDSYSDVYKCKELLGYNLHTFLLHYIYSRHDLEDTKLSFPHGLVVKNLTANSGDYFKPCSEMIPHAMEHLSPSANYWAYMPQLLKSVCPRAHAGQQEKPVQVRSPHTETRE